MIDAAPPPGAVIRYAYLWHREAISGREEGAKDRPCAVVLTTQADTAQTRLYVLPITHSPPHAAATAIEIPPAIKAHLGLDGERSWIILDELNIFAWPGPDLRPIPGTMPARLLYGVLPPRFFNFLRQQFLATARLRQTSLIQRTD